MIKNIKVNWVHWIEASLQFKDHNRITGQSLLGKTTILNCIMACYGKSYPWYANTLPEGEIELETDEWTILMKWKKIIGNTIESDLIRYIVPWNFFRLTNSTVKQREIITKILDVDTNEIETINQQIRDVESKIKEFNTKKDQITEDILRIEWYADAINWVLEEPKKPEIIEWNAEEINAAYNTMIQKIKDKNEEIDQNNRNAKETAEKYKAEEIRTLEIELESITNAKIKIVEKAEEAKKSSEDYNCKECGTLIKWDDKEEVINNLRKEYKDLLEKDDKVRNDLQTLLFDRSNHIDKVLEWLEKTTDYQKEYTLVVEERAKILWMDYIQRNDYDYERWEKEFKDYQEVINKRESYFEEIKVKEQQLKDLNFIVLEKDLKKKQTERTEFNKRLEEKVKETGLDIRLFKTLKNWNIRETFEIYDSDWNMYWATSTGNELYIEVLLAKLFIKYIWVDFILIDAYESIWINLRDKIIEECDSLQVIVTEVTIDNKINLIYNLK